MLNGLDLCSENGDFVPTEAYDFQRKCSVKGKGMGKGKKFVGREELGDRAFPVAAARAWNSLPPAVRDALSPLSSGAAWRHGFLN